MGTLLDRGIYDAGELAVLIGVTADTIVRWSLPEGTQVRLAHPVDAFFNFHDLINLRVVKALRQRGVPLTEVRQAQETLSEKLDTRWPFANERLATAGRAVFANWAEWVDVGKGGQGALQPFVEPYLEDVEYDDSGMAAAWYPQPGVSVNPKIQAGAPCVQGTRVPTATIRTLHDAGDQPEEIADDLHLGLDQVETALAFESAIGLAA